MNGIAQTVSTLPVNGIGIWGILAVILFAWWRGLPKFIPLVIQAITERNAVLQQGFDLQIQRLQQEASDSHVRFAAQIAEADRRHAEADKRHEACIRDYETLRKECERMRGEIEGLRKQWVQQQSSIVAVLPGSMVSQQIQDAVRRVDVMRAETDD